ncbi:MAG: hypothetical protein ACR2P0_03120 [Acidimicrobiales bacterium]
MRTTSKKGIIGRLLVAATLAISATTAVGISAAAADPPATFSDSVTFHDINPCSGDEHEITLNFEIREHQGHKNNFVVHLSRTGTTDDGYVMNHGVETITGNKNVFRAHFTDQWRHADGSKFRVKGVFVAKEDGVVVDRFDITCIGN